MAYIASICFVLGSFSKSLDKMRIFMLAGAVLFTIIFFNSDLTNSCNLSNLLLNCFNIVGHSIYFARKLFKK